MPTSIRNFIQTAILPLGILVAIFGNLPLTLASEVSQIYPCRLSMAAFSPSPDLSPLPMEVDPPRKIPDAVKEQLLQQAEAELFPLYSAETGFVGTDIRGTVVTSFLFMERGEPVKAERSIRAVLNTQSITQENQYIFGNFPMAVGGDYKDRNASAFIGSYLLVFWDRYHNQISADLSQAILASVRLAAIHRSCVPHFVNDNTNIVILSAFTLLRAGEILEDRELFMVGEFIWKNFVSYTLNNGIAEYNSPNYSRIHFYGLGFISDYLANGSIKKEASRLRLLFWYSLTKHYRADMLQIVGPFSRTFTDRMIYEPTNIYPLLFAESKGRIPSWESGTLQDGLGVNSVFPAILLPSWPDKWVDIALSIPTQPSQYRERVERFGYGYAKQITTYTERALALGSVNVEQIWILSEQRRPVIAHATIAGGTDVGVFYINTSAPQQRPVLRCVQDMKALLCVVWLIDRYSGEVLYENSHTLQFVWYGTEEQPPETQELPEIDEQFDILWMGIPMSIRFQRGTVSGNGSLNLSSAESEEAQKYEVVADALFPDPIAGVAYAPLVFGVYFGEAGSSHLVLPAIDFRPLESKQYLVSWNAPDSYLTLEFSAVSDADWWYQVSKIDGVVVEVTPLSVEDLP